MALRVGSRRRGVQMIVSIRSGYRVVLEPLHEDEGGGWVASVPDLPGCMGDGDTEKEALQDADLSIAHWLQHNPQEPDCP